METSPRCPHCGGTHRLMEICPDAPNAVQLLRQFIDGDRSPIHVLAVGGTLILALLWTVLLISAVSG
jgi:hypothetical protein